MTAGAPPIQVRAVKGDNVGLALADSYVLLTREAAIDLALRILRAIAW